MTMELILFKKGSKATNFTLYRQLIKSRITLSSSLIVIPRSSKESLLEALPHCSFDFHPNEKNHPILSCKTSKTEI
jgi:hypothetical protein